MSSDTDFITHLIGFGLTEKEAQCYFYLLKYGPKTPSPLAKALHTYREDTYRLLSSLIDKGMVRPSLSSPTLYTAVELETALEAALKKHESELREKEVQKRVLEALSKRQQFGVSDETVTFKMLKNIKEIVGATLPVIQSTNKEFLFVAPKEGFLVASSWGFSDHAMGFAKRGGLVRGITHISSSMVPHIQKVLAAGEDIRHFDGYRGIFYGVFDRRHSISAVDIDVTRLKPDEPAKMLWTNDPVYARYLVSTFEILWEQSIPAHDRIRALLG